MDEATSALDAETERKLIANLTRRGCTQVVVAHRLSTIRDADLILVMDQGRVIQQGTHESLSQDPKGAYVQLISEIN
jgi:ABC-type bacteriocin/lantibiotic exporter with double-glycine peptidase domain